MMERNTEQQIQPVADIETPKMNLDFAREVLTMESKAVAGLIDLVEDSFVRAAECMYECARHNGSVIVTGVGKAGIIGSKMSATLSSTGTPSHFLHPAEAVHGDLGRVQPRDVILALSHSGESEEILRLIDPIKQREITLISITGDEKSRLARHSDISLCMGKLQEACPLGLAPSVSTTCMLALGDALALTIMKARQFGPEDYARFHPGGALGAKLMTVGQTAMFQKGQSLPIAAENDTIREMLEKSETLKRRGAIMVVDAAGKLSGIITDGDLRRSMVHHGSEMLEMTAAQIMTPDCKRVREDTLAAEAMAIFHKHRIDELPVVDEENKPVGLIDVQDIVAIKIVG